MVSDSVTLAVCGGAEESVTLKVNRVFVTGAVGVPSSSPVDESNVSPFGSVPPTTDQAYGAVPPMRPSLSEYGLATSPFASDVVVIPSPPSTVTMAVVSAIPGRRLA